MSYDYIHGRQVFGDKNEVGRGSGWAYEYMSHDCKLEVGYIAAGQRRGGVYEHNNGVIMAFVGTKILPLSNTVSDAMACVEAVVALEG